MSRVEHPLIGINAGVDSTDDTKVSLPRRYAEAVLKAGGVPVILPPVGGPSDVERLLGEIDGLLLSGGGDFDMERLGLGTTHKSARRTPAAKQDFDVLLVRAALDRRMPVLGICYGMQLLSLVGGASLHQHLPEDRPGTREHSGGTVHGVQLAPGSKLARVVGVEQLDVVSRHHQAIADVGPAWRVAARDDEGLIEAVERPDLAFALGVQWHPELSPEGSPHDRLFRGLVGAAGVAAARRMGTGAAH